MGSRDARQLMQGSIASRARRTGRQTRTDSTSNTAATEAKAASHTGRHTQASRQPATQAPNQQGSGCTAHCMSSLTMYLGVALNFW